MAFTNTKDIKVGTFVRFKPNSFNKIFGNLPNHNLPQQSSLGIVVRYDHVPTLLEVLCEEKVIICHIDDLEKINVEHV